jgi:catechol 2,3-dioxygenase-like lactoylglutathione lyase family enzyme
MQNTINFNGFFQIAIIVKDIDKAAEKWAQILGVPVPEISVQTPQPPSPDLTYRGKPGVYGLKICNIQAGNVTIELHEPDEHDSSYKEFLDEHGQGVHHLGIEVGDKRDAIIAELEEDGYEMRTIGYYPGSSWTVVDSEDALGVNLSIKPVR